LDAPRDIEPSPGAPSTPGRGRWIERFEVQIAAACALVLLLAPVHPLWMTVFAWSFLGFLVSVATAFVHRGRRADWSSAAVSGVACAATFAGGLLVLRSC
jgi:peptidoglycan/LPS O-acetylase OafA/YrhL